MYFFVVSECDSRSDAMEDVSLSLYHSHGWREEDLFSLEAKKKRPFLERTTASGEQPRASLWTST